MNDLVKSTTALMPTDMRSAMELANMMAKANLVPGHLQNAPGNCLLVIEQAMRWGMSPFAVAQCTSVISGKLMFEGKLVSAAVQTSGILSARLSYDFDGEGNNRAVTVKGTLKGEDNPRTLRATLAEAKTTNGMWTKQPDQQLVYFGTRAWARRHTPEIMLGVYAPEEFDEAPRFVGTTINAEPMTEAKAIPALRTRKNFLDLLESEMSHAMLTTDPQVAFDEIMARDDVKRAEDTFTNGAKERFDRIVQTAIGQLQPQGE